ncbi:hypothetical protein M2436_006508 [Streptomyces sp. HB372]|nr:hypothetical protein [Streptomyces sp. HB372]
MVSSEPRCFSRTLSPGLSPVRTVPTSCLRVARVAARRLTPSRALGDVALVLVQVGHQGVDPVEHGADLRFLPGERLVEFGGDGLELVDTAPVEEQGEGAEDLFDLRVPVGAGVRDAAAGGERPACGAFGGRGELNELLTEQAGLFEAGVGVRGELDLPVDLHGDPGPPAVRGQRDLRDAPHGHVVDLDR